MKFTKSLKFKLTIWYSLILSVFCIVFVVSINIWLTQYMNTWLPDNIGNGFLIQNMDRPRLRGLTEEQRLLVMDARMNDLESIRKVTIYMVIPLVLISFGGGYVLASIMLSPLEKLNKEIKSKETSNLNKELEFEDNGDEISELIKSFNRMNSRLGKSFESQKQFVENASHEIKTPLTVIQANLDTVLEDKKITKEELERLLENSKKQVNFMDKLTEDLLLLSMVSSGIDVEMKETDLKELLLECIDDIKVGAKEAGIKINKVGLDKKISVKGNALLLQRVFSNILENSVKYSKGTEINIKVEDSTDNVSVIIEDNGNGIPKDKIKDVFERFYRLDKGRSRKEGGTGLGLSIVKDIVEMHNGKVYIDSEYRDGARFVVELKK